MKDANFKTGLTAKRGAVASIVMTLSTAAVLTMAPMSQAQAQAVSARETKVAIGGGRSMNDATRNARSKISCPWPKRANEIWWNGRPWYNNTWFSMDIGYVCR